MRRIFPYYIISEILPTFLIALLVFTFIMLMTRVMELTDLVIVRGVRFWTILSLLGLSLPYFLAMTIPMATLIAVLLTFLRMSGDQEIVVLKSAGISLYQLLPPVLLFCLWSYLLTSHLTLTMVPEANQSFRNQLLALAKARADVGVKERVFNTGFEKVVLYVNHIPLGSDMMEDLFIQDDRDEETANVIVASRGRIATDPKRRALIFQLFDGVIDRTVKGRRSSETLSFRRYELKLDLEGGASRQGLLPRDQYELPLEELWTATERLKEKNAPEYPAYLMEAHKRLSVPVACLVLGLIAVPLGLHFKDKSRTWGIAMGIGTFFVYYILMTAARTLGESGRYPPGLGIWLPNLVIGAAAVYLLRQANNEASFWPNLTRISLTIKNILQRREQQRENN